MKPDELKKKFGPLNGKYKVHAHHYKDKSSLHDFGKTRDGTPVTANKLVTQFDFVLGVGSIIPHRVTVPAFAPQTLTTDSCAWPGDGGNICCASFSRRSKRACRWSCSKLGGVQG